MSEQMEYEGESEGYEEGEGFEAEGGEDGAIGGLSVEEQAKIAGWNPDHPAGKSAEEFLARNQEHLGLAKAENEKLYGEIAELKNAMMLTTKFLESREQKAMQAGYDRAIREWQGKMEQAAEEGDGEAFREARDKAEQYMKAKESAKVDPIIPEETPQQAIQKEIANHFQNSPPEMFDLASKKEVWIKELQAQGQQGKSLDEAKKIADRAVIQMFNLKRSMPGVEGRGSGGKKASKLSEIPGAQEAYNTLKKKIPDLTVEEYLDGIGE